MPKAKGAEVDWADILAALPDWWSENELPGEPPTAAQLGAILRYVADQTGMPLKKRNGRIYFVGRKIAS